MNVKAYIMHQFIKVKRIFCTQFVSSPEDHVLFDGVHLVLVVRPSRVHVLYHGADVADNGRDNQNPWMVWSKWSKYGQKGVLPTRKSIVTKRYSLF